MSGSGRWAACVLCALACRSVSAWLASPGNIVDSNVFVLFLMQRDAARMHGFKHGVMFCICFISVISAVLETLWSATPNTAVPGSALAGRCPADSTFLNVSTIGQLNTRLCLTELSVNNKLEEMAMRSFACATHQHHQDHAPLMAGAQVHWLD